MPTNSLPKAKSSPEVDPAMGTTSPIPELEGLVLHAGVRDVAVPANAPWDDFFAANGTDLSNRDQPEVQSRESL